MLVLSNFITLKLSELSIQLEIGHEEINVVYFDQPMHALACVHVVLSFCCFYLFSCYAQEMLYRKTDKNTHFLAVFGIWE